MRWQVLEIPLRKVTRQQRRGEWEEMIRTWWWEGLSVDFAESAIEEHTDSFKHTEQNTACYG